MRNRYNSDYERFKVEIDEDGCYAWDKYSYGYNEKHKNKMTEADKDFYKLGGSVVLIMATFLLLILVILCII